MEEAHKEILRQHFVKLIENLDVKEILPHMYQHEIFTLHQLEMIKSEKTERLQAEELIRRLRQRGPKAFSKFYHCLVVVKNDDLARLIQPSVDIQKYRSENGLDKKRPEMKPVSETSAASNKENWEPITVTSGILDNINIEVALSIIGPDEHVYKMVHKPRGLALIINNRKFTSKKKILPERVGTDIDAANMKMLLLKLQYKVTERSNRTVAQMIDDLVEFQGNEYHKKYESMILVILTHGKHGSIYGTDGETLEMQVITRMFDSENCEALQGKPKIFITQACRGLERDSGADRVDSAGGEPHHTVTDAEVFVEQAKKRLPKASDMLLAFATVPGYVSWRNEERGSWFIQSIVETFQKHAHQEELQHLFTKVNQYLSEQFRTSQGPVSVQMSCIESMLRKKFYFNTGRSETSDNGN